MNMFVEDEIIFTDAYLLTLLYSFTFFSKGEEHAEAGRVEAEHVEAEGKHIYTYDFIYQYEFCSHF